jgi:hypothetical protein
VVISAAGFLFIVFGLAIGITGVQILRATGVYKRALQRYGDIPPDRDRNPLDPKTASQELKQMAKLFRPHADLEAEDARMRIIRGGQIWFLLMFLSMASFLALLLIQGPS